MRARLRATIDLSFGHAMSARACKSVVRQVEQVSHINQRSLAPLDLHVSAVKMARLAGLLPSYHSSWQEKVSLVEAPANEAWPSTELVWLTPDAEEVLTHLEDSALYVVGGLVDRGLRRGISTLQRSEEVGARAMRLPLRERLPQADLNTAHHIHPVLTLAATIQILRAVHNGSSWEAAIEAGVPARRWKQRARQAINDLEYSQSHVVMRPVDKVMSPSHCSLKADVPDLNDNAIGQRADV